jgi:hypothetical protein
MCLMLQAWAQSKTTFRADISARPPLALADIPDDGPDAVPDTIPEDDAPAVEPVADGAATRPRGPEVSESAFGRPGAVPLSAGPET